MKDSSHVLLSQANYAKNYQLRDRARYWVIPLVAPYSRVLDVGCYTGATSVMLKGERKCEVVGIDVSREALEVARSRLDDVHCCELEIPGALDQVLEGKKFDVILLLSVLEHLRYPEQTLQSLTEYLQPNGRVIIALPNICCWKSRFRFLRGIFKYEDSGIFDRGHLRFFGLDSARELIRDAGLTIHTEKYFVRFPFDRWVVKTAWRAYQAFLTWRDLLFREKTSTPLRWDKHPRFRETELFGLGRLRPNLLSWKFVFVCSVSGQG